MSEFIKKMREISAAKRSERVAIVKDVLEKIIVKKITEWSKDGNIECMINLEKTDATNFSKDTMNTAMLELTDTNAIFEGLYFSFPSSCMSYNLYIRWDEKNR